MKSRTLAIAAIICFTLRASAAGPAPDASSSPAPARQPVIGDTIAFNDTYQFIFLATLEGLYRDGVSDADVNSLLAKKGKDGGYLNFIYSCPICMPVEGAILTYKLRPQINYMKAHGHQVDERTFGPGLAPEVSEALKSEKAGIRLKAVNELVGKWIQYRMDHSSLTDDQKANLIVAFKKGRDQGMKSLRAFVQASAANPKVENDDLLKFFAPGYEGGDECAICNASLQMPLKLKAQTPAK